MFVVILTEYVCGVWIKELFVTLMFCFALLHQLKAFPTLLVISYMSYGSFALFAKCLVNFFG